jgi:hypothetical protein
LYFAYKILRGCSVSFSIYFYCVINLSPYRARSKGIVHCVFTLTWGRVK